MDPKTSPPPQNDAGPAIVSNSLPPHPRLALRVGFAGNQTLPEDLSLLTGSLAQVFEILATRLIEIAPPKSADAAGPRDPQEAAPPEIAPEPSAEPARRVPRIHQFYSDKQEPILRLVTGLCQGADALAADVFQKLSRKLTPRLTGELAAVIPFEFPVYRSTRPVGFLPEFDEQAARCTYILALDGIYEKPDPETVVANRRRGRAYRAQATLLIRQADLIIAAADPDKEGKPGGTLETVRAALAFELPVVFIHTISGKVTLIEPGDDPASVFAALGRREGGPPEVSAGDPASGDREKDWRENLLRWIDTIVADPEVDLEEQPAGGHSAEHETEATHGEKLLKEFFEDGATPPLIAGENGKPKTRTGLAANLWAAFEKKFRSGPNPASDPPIQAYKLWRDRGTALNYHYSGLYRGAFFLNYILATVAVALAALSLVLLGFLPRHEAAPHAAEHLPASAGGSLPDHHPLSVLVWVLLGLGLIKFACVLTIYRNTHQANKGDWNDKAVDYRYLAERLRTMFYLPRIGSFQPPVAATPQYASRVIRQSAVDWLLDAIIRSISPASLPDLSKEKFKDGAVNYEVSILRLKPEVLLKAVKESWIQQQITYHDRNARTMDRIQTWAENWGKALNITVIGTVVADLILISLEIFLPGLASHFSFLTPWLMFAAALFPAAVGSLNGVRFQSECRRLAERSAILRSILAGRPHAPAPASAPAKAPGRRVNPVTRFFLGLPAFVRTLFPMADREKTPPLLDDHGSKLAAADRLLRTITAHQADPATNPGSWTPEVLRFSESVATIFVHEVAEWSVLYAKEVPEP